MRRLDGITAEMKTSAQRLGRQVIAAEAELDAEANAADEKTSPRRARHRVCP
jgi:hypothetical protein